MGTIEIDVYMCPKCHFVAMHPSAARRHEAQDKCKHTPVVKIVATAMAPPMPPMPAVPQTPGTDDERRAHFFDTPDLAQYLLYDCSKGDILRRFNYIFTHLWGYKAPKRFMFSQKATYRNAVEQAVDVADFVLDLCERHVPEKCPDLQSHAADMVSFLRENERGISLVDAVLRNEDWHHKRGSLRYMTARGRRYVLMIFESMKLSSRENSLKTASSVTL